jgi:hypothetical protein
MEWVRYQGAGRRGQAGWSGDLCLNRHGRLALAVFVLAVGLSAAQGNAALIQPGQFLLHNHPDGNAAPPGYGLRLDELFDVTDDHDKFTFDFDHPDAEVWLDYDGTVVHIYGIAFGGLDAGSTYASDPALTSLVELDFTYTTVELAEGDDDLIVRTPSFTNSGTITWLDTGEVIDLFDRASEEGFTFRFGDENDDEGHRDFSGISGWGWLDHHAAGTHVYSSDWIFTAERVPAPSSLLVVGAGLLLARGRSRHRRA